MDRRSQLNQGSLDSPERIARRDPTLPVLGALGVLLVSSLACIAPGPEPELMPAQFEARVSLLNKSHEMQVLRVRNLRPDVVLDCEQVARDPAGQLKDEVFDAPVRWPLYSDQEIGIGISNDAWRRDDDLRGRQCSAALVESDTVDDIVIFWDDSLPTKTFEFDPDIPEYIKPDPQTVVLRADYADADPDQVRPYRYRPCEDDGLCGLDGEEAAAQLPAGAEYRWETVFERPLHFDRPWSPDDRPQQVPQRCEVPGPGEALLWEEAPAAEWVVIGLHPGVDGCHNLDLYKRNEPALQRDFMVCAPLESLEPLTDHAEWRTVVRFEPLRGGAQGLNIPVNFYDDEGFIADSAQIFLSRGAQLPNDIGLSTSVQPRQDCPGLEASCGQIELPADLVIEASRTETILLRPGESTEIDERVTVHLARSVHRPVVDQLCEQTVQSDDAQAAPGAYFEAATVLRY